MAEKINRREMITGIVKTLPPMALATLVGTSIRFGDKPVPLIIQEPHKKKEDQETIQLSENLELPIIRHQTDFQIREYPDPNNTGNPLVFLPETSLNKKVTPNFTLREFALINTPQHLRRKLVPHQAYEGRTYNSFIRLDPLLPRKLQKIRDLFGDPIIITSPYRSQTYNAKVGGSPRSRHLSGQAADITGKNLDKLRELAEKEFENGGLGWYPNKGFIHVDTRGYNARW